MSSNRSAENWQESLGRKRQTKMDNAIQHWEILQKLEINLANKVRSFMVIGYKGEGVIAAREDGQGFWLGTMQFGSKGSNTGNKPTPLNVLWLIHMAQSDSHILLLNKRGEIYSMGDNDWGQLGLGTVDKGTCLLPQLIFMPHKFISVRCGGEHSLALTEDGKVWAWGLNNNGQVGVPNPNNFQLFLSSPHQIPEFDSHRVVAVKCGGQHSLALTDQGDVYGWGWNDKGQLGKWNGPFQYTPIQIPTPSPVQSMAAGHSHTLLLTQTGEVYACGDNVYGQLGLSNTTRFSSSLVKITILPFISQITSHHDTDLSIAMSSDQRCFAWGLYFIPNLQQLCLTRMRTTLTPATCCLYYPLTHRHSQLPELATFQQELVQFASNRMSEVVKSAVYQSMEPGLRENLTNAAKNFLNSWSKVEVSKLSQRQTEMDNARLHWLILRGLNPDFAKRIRSFMVIGNKGDGVVVATEDREGFWLGTMKFGKGESRTATEPTPLDFHELVQMAQGNSHILLLNKQGEIYSMGENDKGQLGLGTVNEEIYFLPQLISIPQKIISVRCGGGHSLALTENGKVWAWGENNNGQIGVPSSTKSIPSPRQIPEIDTHRVVAVECGGQHSLALTDQGEVYAWGGNNFGQLGDGNNKYHHSPKRIPTLSPVKSMAAGEYHTLLLNQNGDAYECGRNERSQFSLPTDTKFSPHLSKVAGLPPISQIASHYATKLSIAMSSDQLCFVWGRLEDGNSISTPRELPSDYSTVESPLSFYSTHRNTPHSVSLPEILPSQLSARMSRLFDNPETSDVQFVVEQRTIHAHRVILSNFSDNFAQMFSQRCLPQVDPVDPIVKVTISDTSYQAFLTFIRFLYTDCLDVHSNFLPELFELAIQFLLPNLQQLCLTRMRTTITTDTICFYYYLTHRHSQLPELATFQQELVKFASIRMPQIVNSNAYQWMEPDLRNNFINAIQNFRGF